VSSTLLAGLVVAGGAAVAAPLRYVTGLAVQSVHDTVFPWGTFAVNVTGSLLLGIVAGAVGAGAPAGVLTLVGTGVCGAMTTFSTFGFETVRLLEDDAVFEAVTNAAVGLLVGLVACMGGFALAATLT